MDHSQHTAPAGPAASPMTLDADGVAGLLGLTRRYFFDIRRRLEDEHGFPTAIPGLQKWSRPAVRRWIATNGRTFLPADLEAPGKGRGLSGGVITPVPEFDRGAL